MGTLSRHLRSLANPEKAVLLQRFFKTGRGEYGEGDVFLGVMVPQVRAAIRTFKPELPEALELLRSAYHEERLAGVLCMVRLYERGDAAIHTKVFHAYLENTARINNWDLVDLSAPNIVGAQLFSKRDDHLLARLARSELLWERRIAMLSTAYATRHGDLAPALHMAEALVNDSHDLMHKAVGWMLREVGKCDVGVLRSFLGEHARTIPRTTLRYAIEKLPEVERKQWLGMRHAAK